MMRELLPYSARLTLSGADTVALLERIVTCRVDDLAADMERRGALLTPQGKIVADFLLTRTETGCTLDTHPAAIDTLEKRLKLFRLRADVTMERSERDLPETDHGARIRAGIPVFDTDYGEAEVFPSDINLDLLGGVDYKKGCFVGQEVVSRMKRRGKIRKRTLCLIASALTKGEDIRAGNTKIGTVTSAAADCALAVMRLDHLAKAMAEDIPLTASGQTVSLDAPDWLAAEMQALEEA